MKRKPPQLDAPYRKHRKLTEEEAQEFTSHLSGKKEKPGKPVAIQTPKQVKATPVKPSKKIKPLATIADTLDAPTRKKLKRGLQKIEATLDLHGETRDSAYDALLAFIKRARARDQRLVLVITGKGKKEGEGVLRALLPRLFAESPFRAHIIAYDGADAVHGGSGAWYVRLRKKDA